MNKRITTLIAVLFTFVTSQSPLPYELPIRNDTITISGVSSGGAMAVQLHVAHSSVIKGVGLIASPPYNCAKGSVMKAYECMFLPELISTDDLINSAKNFASNNEIDPLKYLINSPVWLFSGILDTIVRQPSVKKLEAFYNAFGATVTSNYNVLAEHAWITDNTRDAMCIMLIPPYINNCQLDAAGVILNKVLFEQFKITPKPRTSAVPENLFKFDQSNLTVSGTIGLAGYGYVYIPTNCQKRTTGKKICHLHITMHGCNQNEEKAGDAFFRRAGLNEWAESNNIVVLYPQAVSIALVNPEACFDWWYSANYQTKLGGQIQSIMNMIERLTSSRFH